MEFRGHTNLLSYPDPRRIDIRQTIRDPLEQIHVRLFNQKSATPVYVLCDLSGSMGFGVQRSKIARTAEIAEIIAYSASQQHDPFALIGFDNKVREDWTSSLSFKSQQALALTQHLRDYKPRAVGCHGISDVYKYLTRERALVFLISDFHLPESLLSDTLDCLQHHHIVPIVLWDKMEYENLPQFGLVTVRDAESAATRTLFLRRALRNNIIRAFEERRDIIKTLFYRFDMPPFFVEGDFDVNLMSEYFQQFVAR